MKSNESLRGAANGKKWKRVIVTTRYKGKQKPGQSGSLQISDPRRTYVTPQFANLCPRLVDGLRDAAAFRRVAAVDGAGGGGGSRPVDGGRPACAVRA